MIKFSQNETQEKLLMPVLKLLTNFLFTYGFRAKKAIRGLAGEWVNSLLSLLKCSKFLRFWFATTALFRHPERFVEYLLECPNEDVRKIYEIEYLVTFCCRFLRLLVAFLRTLPAFLTTTAPTTVTCQLSTVRRAVKSD